uniref:Uncharacterized protein n=1 Tax=Arundo donax TaxID=35708 RepID=A0A0A9DCV1_ARUDO
MLSCHSTMMLISLHCSGKAYDDTLLAKFESVYTDSGDHSSTMVCFYACSFFNLANFSHYLLSPSTAVASGLFSM